MTCTLKPPQASMKPAPAAHPDAPLPSCILTSQSRLVDLLASVTAASTGQRCGNSPSCPMFVSESAYMDGSVDLHPVSATINAPAPFIPCLTGSPAALLHALERDQLTVALHKQDPILQDPHVGALLWRLLHGISLPQAMQECFNPEADLDRFYVRTPEQKHIVISAMEANLSRIFPQRQDLQQAMVLAAEELVQNALAATPTNPFVSRNPSAGCVTVTFGRAADCFVILVSDSHGTLQRQTVLEHLRRNVSPQALNYDDGGRGLYLLWSLLHFFCIVVEPGRGTHALGLVHSQQPFSLNAPKGLYFLSLS